MMTKKVLCTACLALSLAACGAGNDETDQATDLESEASDSPSVGVAPIVTVQRSKDNVVEFYEPEPGVLLVSEAGSALNPPLTSEIDVEELSVAEIHQYLRPNDAVPQILLDADKRARGLQSAVDTVASPLEPRSDLEERGVDVRESRIDGPSLGTVAQAAVDDSKCPWSWFSTNVDACSWDLDWDVEWGFRTGETWFKRTETIHTRIAACSYRGTILLTVKYQNISKWQTLGNWPVEEGHYRWVKHSRWPGDFVVKSTVSNADGDGYHHCGTGSR